MKVNSSPKIRRLSVINIRAIFVSCITLVNLIYGINLQVFGQNFSTYVELSQTGKEVGILGNYLLNSNTASAQFTNTLYKGGKLDEAIINKASNRLGGNNRFGGDASYGLYYVQHPKRNDSITKMGYFLAMNWKANASAEFSSDLFNWVFRGNKEYAGTKSYLGGSRFNLVTWREVKGGLMWEKKSGKNRVEFGVNLALLQGRTLFNTRLTQLEVEMDTLGTYLDIKSRMNASISAPNRNAYDGRAYGLALGGFFVTEYEKGFFKFEISDLGFLNFDTKTRLISNDTLFRYQGYRFNSTQGLADSISNFFTLNSVKAKYNVRDIQNSAMLITPAWFKIAYEFKLKKNAGLEFGVMERLAYGWFPYLYSQYRVNLTPSFNLKTRISYGGYGGLSLGLYLDKRFGNHFAIGIGSNAFEGFILPKVANGQGAYINVRALF